MNYINGGKKSIFESSFNALVFDQILARKNPRKSRGFMNRVWFEIAD
jgi:hypothetical protein